MSYISEDDEGDAVLTVYVQPRSSRNCITGAHGDALKICITTPPVDGKANKAIIDFLAKFFRIPKSSVILQSGETSRHKKIKLMGVSTSQALSTITNHF